MVKKKTESRTFAYLRVSTLDQDLDKFKRGIKVFANDRDFGRVKFIEEKVSGTKPWRERKVKGIIDELGKGDRLIVPELTRLGRSTLDVLDVLQVAKEKGIDIFSVKEGLALNGDGIQTKILTTVLALVSEIERDFISIRTKEALQAAKARGVRLGRPPGPGKSKLDKDKDAILDLLVLGVPKKKVAEMHGTSNVALWQWLNKHGLNAELKKRQKAEMKKRIEKYNRRK